VDFRLRCVINSMSGKNTVVSRLVKPIAVLCAVLCFCLGASAQVPADKVHVDVQAQNLLNALTQFGRDTGTEIEFSPEVVHGKTSVGVVGDYDRISALKLLLAGTGLSYRLLPQGAIVVEAAPRTGAVGASAQRAPQSATTIPRLDTLTVEGRRQREETKHQIEAFVHSVVNPRWDESLPTWQIPICPFVAGMPRDVGEYVRHRISETTKNADAPLGPEKCRPNFFVVIATQPDEVLKNWRRRYPRSFNEARGVAGIKKFIGSSLPVRIWYNVDDGCPGSLTYAIATNSSSRKSFPFPSCSHTGGLGSRLTQEVVRVIWSVIVVVDNDHIQNINIGQLADYAAMIGLAEVRLDNRTNSTPSILNLFSVSEESRPQELSVWDKALLKGLYNTYPNDVTRVSKMETRMLEYLMQ
jgi:hypothetical protein